ncbi:MAG: PilZ domain-containing protein [Candidatus Krumholzibacteriota bacterium]
MEDYRHRPRKNTPHKVKVLMADSGHLVGRVVDITADGMMLVTKDDIKVGKHYEFRIILPVMVHHRTDVTLEARAIWKHSDGNPDYSKCGFKFVNLPGEEGFLLEDVMHKLNLVG